MKNPILTLIAVAIFFGGFMVSCSESDQSVADAQTKIDEAETQLQKAQEEYQMEVEKYRAQTASTISSNNEEISEFNTRIDKEKKELRADYKLKIDELQRKNQAMEQKMITYRSDNKEQWQDFKADFNKDMEKLDQELKALTKKNK